MQNQRFSVEWKTKILFFEIKNIFETLAWLDSDGNFLRNLKTVKAVVCPQKPKSYKEMY